MAVIGAGPALGDGVMKHSGLSGAPIKQDNCNCCRRAPLRGREQAT